MAVARLDASRVEGDSARARLLLALAWCALGLDDAPVVGLSGPPSSSEKVAPRLRAAAPAGLVGVSTCVRAALLLLLEEAAGAARELELELAR